MMSRSCPWSKKAACYCSLIRESKTAAAPKGERDAAYADLPLNHSCLRGPTSFMIICRRLFDLTPSASLCEGTPKPRSTIIWREGPALYSTVCDGVDRGNAVEMRHRYPGWRGNGVEMRRRRAARGFVVDFRRRSWKCRGKSTRRRARATHTASNPHVVEMPWK